MENLYKGYGTSYKGYESNTKSGIKLQLVFDYLNQTLDRSIALCLLGMLPLQNSKAEW